MHRSRSLFAAAVTAAAAALGVASASHAAPLTVDLRLPGNLKSANVVAGQDVTLNVFATLANTDGNAANDTLTSVYASFLSTGALSGNFTSALTVSPFNATGHQDTDASGAQDITPIDLDGDLDLDIGSNVDASAPGFFLAQAPSAQSGTSFQIGTLTFHVTGNSGSTNLNFRPRNAAAGALYRDDNTVRTGTTGPGLVAFGTPVTLSVVPEPTGLALVGGVTGMGLLARRRRNA